MASDDDSNLVDRRSTDVDVVEIKSKATKAPAPKTGVARKTKPKITNKRLTSAFTDDTETKDNKKKIKIKHTDYFITINTNETFSEMQEEKYNRRAEQLAKIWENVMDNIHKYTVFKEPHEEDTFCREKIKAVNNEYAIERGGKTGYLHLHAILQYSHYSKIQINIPLLKEDISKALWGPDTKRRVFFNSQFFKDSKINLLEYINKNAKNIQSRIRDD